jgi:glycosyltransferase involved in cell wall biosynthesis
MQTLQIGDEWPTVAAGGLNSYFYELVRHLEPTGTSVHGLVLGSGSIGHATHGQINHFSSRNQSLPKRMLSARRAAVGLLSHTRIDLVASHFALNTFPILDWLKTKPLVVHFHGPWAAESDVESKERRSLRFKASVERSVYSRARRLVVLSRAFERVLVESYSIKPERIRIVPGGIDAERFNTNLSRAEARERLGWPADRPIILTVRRQVRRMGLEVLIDAAEHIVRHCPEVLILLGGTGPIASELDRRIIERGLARNVTRLGRIEDEDLPLAYRAANLTVVPSQSLEGFGLITLESLASGTPVYVTPVGGLPEIVTPFAPECVFPGSTAEDIASVLSEVLQAVRPVPSEAACRAYAANNFSWQRIAQQVRTVYDEAL